MATQPAERRARRRAIRTLAGLGLALAAVIVTAIVVLTRHDSATHTAIRPAIPAPPPTIPARTGWDTTAEHALAARPMLALPPQAAQPQPLTTTSAGPPISLPKPAVGFGHRTAFPRSPEGAVAQLKALDEQAMAGGDPNTYDRDYRERALAGAPDPRATGLSSVLVSFRATGGLPGAGFVPDLSVDYQVTEGLIKGAVDQGRYTVACVLGELTVQYQDRTVTAGVGDCQALRWTGTDWRISPGNLAAPAPCAWPGSVDAVEAGYRELS